VTTSAFAHDGPTRPPFAGRLGALAGVTPIAMFGAWVAISGWGGAPIELVRGRVAISLGAVAAGWIIGVRLGDSITGLLVGLVTYGPVAYLLLLPLNVAGATFGDLQAGRLSDAVGIVVAATGYLLYGLVAGIYTFVFLLPFGAGWIVTFLILRRVFER
jgi:hypothetical protein